MNNLSSEEIRRRQTLVERALAQNLDDGMVADKCELEIYAEFVRGELQLLDFNGPADKAKEGHITALQRNALCTAYDHFSKVICLDPDYVSSHKGGVRPDHAGPAHLKTEKVEFNIYELIDPICNERFYIGKTRNIPTLRYSCHLGGTLPSTRGRIFSLAKRGVRIDMRLLDRETSPIKAHNMERQYILDTIQQGVRLVNRGVPPYRVDRRFKQTT